MGTEYFTVTSVSLGEASPAALAPGAVSLVGLQRGEPLAPVFQPDFQGRVSQPNIFSPPVSQPSVLQQCTPVRAWAAPTFYPNQADDPPSARGQLTPSRHPSPGLGGLRVLVVEDDPDARELVAAILEDAGAVVESAESAAAGFAAVQAFRPQLLVSDIGMPDEDGYSLIRRVRALGVAGGGAIPSIALTAYTQAQDRAKALDAGFNLHMGKPIKPTDLVAAVKTLASTDRN